MKMINPFFYAHDEIAVIPGQLLQVVLDGVRWQWQPTFLSCEHFSGDPDWRGTGTPAQEHAHNVYHLLLYLNGEGAFSWQGQWHAARRGTLVLTEPGQSHEFGGKSRTAFSYVQTSFRLTGAPTPLRFSDYLQALTGLKALDWEWPLQLGARAANRLEGLFETALAVLTPSRPRSWHLLERAVLDLFFFLAAGEERAGQTNPEPLEAARRELEWRLGETVSVPELARIACLSPGHFQRAFRDAFGDSPIHYQKVLRIREAKQLLLTTGLSCKEIAGRLGFHDEYHFNKMFHALAGSPPGVFRRQERL